MKNQNSETFTFGEIELSYKRKRVKRFHPIKNSKNIEVIIRNIFPKNQIIYREKFLAFFLTNKNEVIGYNIINTEVINNCMVDIRLIFQTALKTNAVAFIISHNHPSGNLKPSEQDRRLTNKIVNAGEVLDIKVLDHIIITENSYYSFADNGDL